MSVRGQAVAAKNIFMINLLVVLNLSVTRQPRDLVSILRLFLANTPKS